MNRIHFRLFGKTRDDEREGRTSSLVHLTQVEESLKALRQSRSVYISACRVAVKESQGEYRNAIWSVQTIYFRPWVACASRFFCLVSVLSLVRTQIFISHRRPILTWSFCKGEFVVLIVLRGNALDALREEGSNRSTCNNQSASYALHELIKFGAVEFVNPSSRHRAWIRWTKSLGNSASVLIENDNHIKRRTSVGVLFLGNAQADVVQYLRTNQTNWPATGTWVSRSCTRRMASSFVSFSIQ